jgi:regulator of cell morphogenesis and NO signaling
MENNMKQFEAITEGDPHSIDDCTVGELVTRNLSVAEVLIQHKIDYCCGGKKTLSEACMERGLDLPSIRNKLTTILNSPTQQTIQYSNWSLDVLIDQIIHVHHAYVRKSLDILAGLAEKVMRTHGHRHPELLQIQSELNELADELLRHMIKEERILFPYIESLLTPEGPKGLDNSIGLICVQDPIQVMEWEHEAAAHHLDRIRQLSQSYTPPDHACTSFRLFYSLLKEFEYDLHHHVHLENNILFPKAIELESMLIPN